MVGDVLLSRADELFLDIGGDIDALLHEKLLPEARELGAEAVIAIYRRLSVQMVFSTAATIMAVAGDEQSGRAAVREMVDLIPFRVSAGIDRAIASGIALNRHLTPKN